MTLPRRGITSRLRKISYNGRRDEIPADPTVDEFTKLYGIVITTADSPPSKVTSERYVRCLQRVCEGGGVKRIRRLNAAAVERFKDSYIRSALPEASQGRRNAATTAMAMAATRPPPNNTLHVDAHNALRASGGRCDIYRMHGLA